MQNEQIKFMSKAIKLAERALLSNDVPVGAIVVYDGKIIGRGYNQIERKKSPIAHAEIIAINSAVKKIGYKHLLDCDIYITLEPCSMCAGAIVLARINRVYIGAKDPKTGAAGSVFNLLQNKKLNHLAQVNYGILEDECSQILKDFFKKLRKSKSLGK